MLRRNNRRQVLQLISFTLRISTRYEKYGGTHREQNMFNVAVQLLNLSLLAK